VCFINNWIDVGVSDPARCVVPSRSNVAFSFAFQISNNNGKGLSLFCSCAFLEDCHLTSNAQGALSLSFTSSAALRHCDVRKNGSQPFMVGARSTCVQGLEYEEGDCFLYSQECTGDDKSMAEWLDRGTSKRRWMQDTPEDSSSSSSSSSSSIAMAVVGEGGAGRGDLRVQDPSSNSEQAPTLTTLAPTLSVSVSVSVSPPPSVSLEVTDTMCTNGASDDDTIPTQQQQQRKQGDGSCVEISQNTENGSVAGAPVSFVQEAGDVVAAVSLGKKEQDDSSPMEIE
jgi:hypothetical protein